MGNFVYFIVFLGMYYKGTFCDQNCDNAMAGKAENYAYRISSSDLIMCYEDTHVKCAGEYAPVLLEKRPTMYFDVGKSCKMVTIMFFGNYTDSTSLLWLVFDVPATDLKNGFHGQSGNERVIYTMPKDSSSSTDHFFFVYCQRSQFDNFNCCTYEERENTNVKELSKKNNLNPVDAAIYFKVTATDQLMEEKPIKDAICKGK